MKRKKVNCELTKKYKVGDKIETKYGSLPIVGFIPFKRYLKEEYMMFPYLEYNNKEYIFNIEETTPEGIHPIIEFVRTFTNPFLLNRQN